MARREFTVQRHEEIKRRLTEGRSVLEIASALDLSVAVASQCLKRLERHLGVRLLHRTTGQLSATPEGAALAEQGRVLVEEMQALTASLRQAGTGVAGTLRVTTVPLFGRMYVRLCCLKFMVLHPNVKLSFDLSDATLGVAKAGFDLAIGIAGLDGSSLVARKLATNTHV